MRKGARPQEAPTLLGSPLAGVPLGPAQHVWDGRLLVGVDGIHQAEAQPNGRKPGAQADVPKRTTSLAEHSVATNKGTKHTGQALSSHHANKVHECPMTPPRVAGVSMAPVAGNVDFPFPEISVAPQQQQQQRQPGGADAASSSTKAGAGKRTMSLKVTVQNVAGGPSGAGDSYGHHQHHSGGRLNPLPAAPSSLGAAGSLDHLAGAVPAGGRQFMAEGRAVTLTRVPGGQLAPEPQQGDEGSVPCSPMNNNLVYYQEINEADSLCGTPPSISISTLNREFDPCYPLGPLSPSPLSPSILTLCGPLSEMEVRDGSGSGEGCLGLWCTTSYGDLPDMRECNSPHLKYCDSPVGVP